MARQLAAQFGILDGQPRFRMVAAGGNMEAPTFADLIYDSNLSTVKVRTSGVLAFTIGTGCYGQQHVVTWPDFGFIPFVLLAICHPSYLWTYGPRTNGSLPIEIGANTGLGYNATDNNSYPVRCAMPNMFYDQSNLQGGSISNPGGTGPTPGGRYEKWVFNALVKRDRMTVTNWLAYQPGATEPYRVFYYVLDLPIG
ncbi:hypothetical protein [Kaistia adipata]|uniref:hypothetical protein n=1 Tax=Kaistia adipata TaxID=166954 RepID=UPI0003FED47E|nr:hypothetical protein [Kaistia adipata]